MDDATLSLAAMLLWASVLIFALVGVWLVSLGWNGKWRTFCAVIVVCLIVVGLFTVQPLATSQNGLLADWDMAFMLGGAALLGGELAIAAILGCVARIVKVRRTKRILSTQ